MNKILHVKPQPRYRYHAPIYCYPAEMRIAGYIDRRERAFVNLRLKMVAKANRKDIEDTLKELRTVMMESYSGNDEAEAIVARFLDKRMRWMFSKPANEYPVSGDTVV